MSFGQSSKQPSRMTEAYYRSHMRGTIQPIDDRPLKSRNKEKASHLTTTNVNPPDNKSSISDQRSDRFVGMLLQREAIYQVKQQLQKDDIHGNTEE